MAFAKRRIDLEFRLGKGSFGANAAGGENNSVKLSGLRCIVNISKAGGVSMSSLDLRVFGMELEAMNRLTVLNMLRYTDARFNTVTVSAGDDENGMAVCFTGIINQAWADMRSPPDAVFHVSAHTGFMEAVKPVSPVSYKGVVDVATVLAGIAAQMQPVRSLENSGVDVRISNPYLPGTLRDQALAVAKAAAINLLIDDTVLAIWPKGQTRKGAVPHISPTSGLVGYPVFTQNGVQLTTVYNPNLVFGQRIEVRSELEPANGFWTVAGVTHNLSCEVPGGPWFSQVECGLIGQSVPIVG